MSLIKTPEDEFILSMEGYLDTKFDKYSVNKIMGMLKKYKSQIPPRIEKVNSERVITKYIDTSTLKICTKYVLEREAKKMCRKLGISYDLFMEAPKKKSTSMMTDARKVFCRFILEHYNSRRVQLQEFFNVDHSTIIYYLNDNYKQYIKKAS